MFNAISYCCVQFGGARFLMLSLVDYVREAPVLRAVYIHRIRRPVVMACSGWQIDSATKWCREATGKAPDAFYLKDTVDRRDIALVSEGELRSDPSIAVVIFGNSPRSVAIKLAQAGIHQVHFHQSPPFEYFKTDPQFLKENRDKLEAVFDLLIDDDSRKAFASVIKQRICADHGFLRIAEYPEYEHPQVKAEPGDWVIDGGACDGTTSVAFARAAGPSGKVSAIEPDPSNISKIQQRLVANEGAAPVNVHCAALADREGTIQFELGKGGSSRIVESGGTAVPVTTLDRLAEQDALCGSGLISLDIEGYEGAALKGGVEMMQDLRPKLQISIYHRWHDLFSLPLWIAQRLNGYRFFVGHHDAYHCETDLYAVPGLKRKP